MGGSGTESAPYRITCREDLEALTDTLKSFYTDCAANDGKGFLDSNFKQYNKHFKVTNDFTIIFENTEEQKSISIELIDMNGAKVLDIYEGIASTGKQIYKVVDKKLATGTYVVKFIISDKSIIRKLIVK